MNHDSAILVVDDSHANLKLLTEILTVEGYQVRSANRGVLALASVSAESPELILLDLNMPGMDGFEVLRQLKAREESRDIPVIILSALTEVEQRVEGFNLGAVDFISKPFQRDELLSRVRTHLELSALSRENVRKGRELAKALADLQQTQVMLVQQEKMASLGLTTAGIAHEINNPLAFVLSNEQVLKRDFDDLFSFINTLGDVLPEIAVLSPRIHGEIVAKAGEIGLEYLAESLPRKIAANIEGLERVKQIVLDLRNFSRLDEAERKYCHLAEGIESSLRFLGPLLEEQGVTVETEFACLPQLFCSPGTLNQAFSNVLANAIQASRPGQSVRVSTRLDGDWYCVEVADQGDGIPAEHLTRVFDPFFTTKPVGSGTGLGLSIAHQIVAKHDGRIEIDSLPGSGTTIRILLPKNQQGYRAKQNGRNHVALDEKEAKDDRDRQS